MKFALACLPTVREEQVAAVAVVAAGAYDKAGCRQQQASKQTMDTVSRPTAADAGGCPEAWCLEGGEVGLKGVDQVQWLEGGRV